MALHPIELPPEARDLMRIVHLQRKLLKALAVPALQKTDVDNAWMATLGLARQQVIRDQAKIVAAASAVLRQSIYQEFQTQIRIKCVWESGGDFRKLTQVTGMTDDVESALRKIFLKFYDRLGEGYEFGGRTITKQSYKEHFKLRNRGNAVVCPYCDGENLGPELDHFYPISEFPFLSCHPLNLVPVCNRCNAINNGKSNRIALPPESGSTSLDEWFHPFFRAMAPAGHIALQSAPNDSKPNLTSNDADPCEKVRAGYHMRLIPNLRRHWTARIAHYFDDLVRAVKFKAERNSVADADFNAFVLEKTNEEKDENVNSRGTRRDSLIQRAVCEAILYGRPGYRSEFSDPNPPTLTSQ